MEKPEPSRERLLLIKVKSAQYFMMSAAFVAACPILLLFSGCSRDIEGEIVRYHKNRETVERFMKLYPRHGRFLRYELEKAKSLWYGSLKVDDHAKKKQMIQKANEIIYHSSLLGYLHSYDGRCTRMHRNIKIIEPYKDDEKYRVRVRRVLKNARLAMDRAAHLMSRARPANERDAIDSVHRADEMLVKPEAQVLRLKKMIRDERLQQKTPR